MSKIQQKRITPSAAPLQRSYGVIALPQKYATLSQLHKSILPILFYKNQENNKICILLNSSIISPHLPLS